MQALSVARSVEDRGECERERERVSSVGASEGIQSERETSIMFGEEQQQLCRDRDPGCTLMRRR